MHADKSLGAAMHPSKSSGSLRKAGFSGQSSECRAGRQSHRHITLRPIDTSLSYLQLAKFMEEVARSGDWRRRDRNGKMAILRRFA
jgi:hypothetical protein